MTVERSRQTPAARFGPESAGRAASLTAALQRVAEAERARHRGEAVMDPRTLGALSLERFSGLFAVAIVDREHGLRWAQARASETPSIADVQAMEQACDVVLRRPVTTSPTVVDRDDLPAGGSGVVIAVPVRDEVRVVSFVVGLSRGDDFVGNTQPHRPAH